MARYSWIILAVVLLAWGILLIQNSLVRKLPDNVVWQVVFPEESALSSPRPADLTGDGVLDVVLGAGKNRFVAADTAVVALDGASGRMLWTLPASDQMIGSATFLDINGDETPDVVIGGRHAELLAIDGRNGALIWRYHTQDTAVNAMGYARFNFFNTQLVPDQNGDGREDLLVANGGNEKAAPYDEVFRYPGVLLLIDSRNGRVIAADTMPDGKETYMSPLVYDFGSGDPAIIFGTGGEKIGGGLFRTTLRDLRNDDISGARRLATGARSGFIAPPVLADVNRDGVADVAVCSFDGEVLAFDGQTFDLLWRTSFQGAETYSTPAAGFFTNDTIPGFFATFQRPQSPMLQVLLDGASGKVLFQDSLGCMGMSSPVAYDIDQDGRDEALLSINEFNCSNPNFLKGVCYLALYDFNNGEVTEFTPVIISKNAASTPWLGDLDGDGRLDVVQVRLSNTGDFYDFRGMWVERLATDIPCPDKPAWGAYMGSGYDGVFREERRRAQPRSDF